MTVSNQTYPETRRETSGLFTRTNRTLAGFQNEAFKRTLAFRNFKKYIVTTTLSILIQFGRPRPLSPE